MQSVDLAIEARPSLASFLLYSGPHLHPVPVFLWISVMSGSLSGDDDAAVNGHNGQIL